MKDFLVVKNALISLKGSYNKNKLPALFVDMSNAYYVDKVIRK